MKKYKLVMIEWQDAWANTIDCTDILIHTTVGFLYRETKDEICLAQSYYSVEDKINVNNFFGIPRGCIKKYSELRM